MSGGETQKPTQPLKMDTDPVAQQIKNVLTHWWQGSDSDVPGSYFNFGQ